MFLSLKRLHALLIFLPVMVFLFSSCSTIEVSFPSSSTATENTYIPAASPVSYSTNTPTIYSHAYQDNNQLLYAGNTAIGGTFTGIDGSWTIEGCPLGLDTTSKVDRLVDAGIRLGDRSDIDPYVEVGIIIEVHGDNSTITPYYLTTGTAKYYQSFSSSSISCDDQWQASIEPSSDASGSIVVDIQDSTQSLEYSRTVPCDSPCTFPTASWGLSRNVNQSQNALPAFQSIDFMHCTASTTAQSTQPLDSFIHTANFMKNVNVTPAYTFAFPSTIYDDSEGSNFSVEYN